MGKEAVFNTAIDKLFISAYPSATKAFERTGGKNACLLLPSSHGQWFLCFAKNALDPVDAAQCLLGQNDIKPSGDD